MGLSVSPNPECWKLRTPYSSSPFDSWKTPRVVSSLPLRHVTERNNNNNNITITMPCFLVNGSSAFSSSRHLRRVQRVVKRVCCSSHFDDFHHEEMMNLAKVSDKGSLEEKFCTMEHELLEPSLLGIQPEPPSWPEREEILRLGFERRVKSMGIPLSIRMIQKKLQLEEGFQDDAGELLTQYCSVKKTFNSMLFILHELQNHALQTRENLCCEDLQSVMAKLRRDMDASFVWLFQQVFWETPNLMVNVMVFLANFSVFSMSDNNTFSGVTPSSMITEVLSLTNNKSKQQQHSQVDVGVDQDECVKEELTEEDEMLWNSMLEEWRGEVLDHNESVFVAPVSVELEGDQYEEYVKTELYYKKHLSLTPYSSLLLSNYAHFLFLVVHDIDG